MCLARAESSRARRSANIPPTLSERTAGVSESCRKKYIGELTLVMKKIL